MNMTPDSAEFAVTAVASDDLAESARAGSRSCKTLTDIREMALALVFGTICQSGSQKLLPGRYIVLTTVALREGTLSLWPTSRPRTQRTGNRRDRRKTDDTGRRTRATERAGHSGRRCCQRFTDFPRSGPARHQRRPGYDLRERRYSRDRQWSQCRADRDRRRHSCPRGNRRRWDRRRGVSGELTIRPVVLVGGIGRAHSARRKLAPSLSRSARRGR